MALENDDLIVVQKNGGGELRKAKIGDIKPDVPINDGAINIDGGDGITASGDNATANQDGDTTRTLSVDETWLSTWLDTNHPLPETFWTEDSGNLYPTTLTNNVGIGTDAPESLFHLKSADAEVLQIMENSVGTVKLYSNNKNFIVDADQHRFRSESGDEYARILANGNVGIGTDSPSSELEVDGFIQSSSGLKFNDTDSSYGLFPLGSQTLVFNINGSEKVRFLSNGNVGIGSSNPGRKLTVKADDQFDGIHVIDSNGQNVVELIGTGSDGSNGGLVLWDGSNKLVNIRANGDSNISGGNVGIGTDTPQTKLHVFEPSDGNADAYSALQLSAHVWSGVIRGGVKGGVGAEMHLGIRTNDTTEDVITIDSFKNVGIGIDAPSGKLDVQNGANRAIKFEVDGTSGDNHIKSYQGNSENVRNLRITGQEIAIDTNSSGESQGVNRIKVLTNGDVGIGTDAPAQKLHVVGGNIQLDSERGVAFGNINTRLQGVPDGTFKFIGNGSEKVRIDAEGRIGIGTDAPGGKLAVNTPADVSTWQLRVQTDGINNESGFYRDKDNGFIFDVRDDTGAVTVGLRAKEGRVTAQHYNLETLPSLP